MTKRSFVFLALLLMFTVGASLAHAAADTNTDFSNGLVPCGHESNAQDAANSCDLKALNTLIQRLINFGFFIGILVTVYLLLTVGFQFLTAGGKTMQLSDARKKLTTIVWGFALMLGAWLIIKTVVDILIDPKSGITNPLTSMVKTLDS